MIKKASLLALLAAAVLLTGCSTIHFENGPVTPDPVPDQGFSWTMGLFDDDPSLQYDTASSLRYRRWYHHAIFSIAELSNPLQTGIECSGLDWNQITTEVTFWDFVAGLVDNALLYNASSVGLDLWSPWSIEYSCR
jgi:hypothetical protein